MGEPDDPIGPFIEMDRASWADLADHTDIDLDDATLARLRGLGDATSQEDVAEVYLPLTQLIHLRMRHTGHLYRATNAFLNLSVDRTPFIVGVAGSVAVGKSTTARLLRELLSQCPGNPNVELVTTDGFLLPNAELEKLGLMARKGFPNTYDRKALVNFVVQVKSGAEEVRAPVYSHMVYDILPGESEVIRRPDILIVEGLNVLQPARRRENGTRGLSLADFFDFSVYVDADEEHIKRWFTERFLVLRETAFTDPRSYFTRFASMSDDQASAFARRIWDEVNGPNLKMNIRPTRGRATAILYKAHDHGVRSVRVRKL